MILHVRAVAQAVDFNRKRVVAVGQHIGDVKLRALTSVLGVSQALAVQPDVDRRGKALEAQIHGASFPIFRHPEGAAVGTDGVTLLEGRVTRIGLAHDKWRIDLEVIADILVERRAIALHLHTTGHGDRRPGCRIERWLIEGGRTLVGMRHPVELPLAVEREKIGRLLT